MLSSLKAYLSATWKFFSSIRLAIILILILVGLSLIGALVIQAPAGYTSDPQTYSLWLQNIARPQTGIWFPLLNFGDLFSVFHSPWFLGTGSLLIINIVVCTINRWRRTRSSMARSRIINSEDFYSSGKESVDLSDTFNSESVNQLSRNLKKHRYSVKTVSSSGMVYLAADKNRFSPLGTYLIHLSLILLIAGYVAGNSLGFRDTSFIVPEQSTRDIGFNTGLSLHLNTFTDEFYPNGSPKDYRSNVTLYKNGSEVKTGVVRVNHPLNYDGINIYQSFFGPAAVIQVSDANGNVLFNGDVALSGSIPVQNYVHPVGEFTLTKDGYIVFVTGSSGDPNDNSLKQNQVELDIFTSSSMTPVVSTVLDKGVLYKSSDLQVTYLGDAMFSGFQISHNPGTNVIWIASALLLLGLFAVFYFPRRRVWAFIRNSANEEKRFVIRVGSFNKIGADIELKKLVEELEKKKD